MIPRGSVTVVRYDPARDAAPQQWACSFPLRPGMTALDVLLWVHEEEDPDVAFPYCCRNSHCGVCGATINGRPGLLCREAAGRNVRLEPLRGLPVVRDLVVDLDYLGGRYAALRLFLERRDAPGTEPERIPADDLERFKVVSRCVACHCCVAVCPVYKKRPHDFIGPCGLVLLARHAFDPRDDADRELIARTSGASLCTHCGKCRTVCPHGIDPDETVRMLLTPAADW